MEVLNLLLLEVCHGHLMLFQGVLIFLSGVFAGGYFYLYVSGQETQSYIRLVILFNTTFGFIGLTWPLLKS
jgi:hypothetical protein